MYRYILRESCSQFDSLPLISLTTSPPSIVQTSIAAKATTSTVEIYSPSGDVSGFPRFKQLDIETGGGAVSLRNLFGIGGDNPEDGFTVDSNGGPVELNTIKAGPVEVNSGGGECSVMYRYILRESCSQFDSLPLTSLTISGARRR